MNFIFKKDDDIKKKKDDDIKKKEDDDIFFIFK